MNPTANKRKGAQWEIDLLNYFRSLNYQVERLRLSGKQDEGDLALERAGMGDVLVIEAKNVAKLDLAGWVKQAQLEAKNYDKRRQIPSASSTGVVVHKRKQHGVDDAYVTLSLKDFLWLVM